MEADGHAAGQVDRGNRGSGEVAGVDDDDVARVARRVVHDTEQPPVVLAGVRRRRCEHGLGGGAARPGLVALES